MCKGNVFVLMCLFVFGFWVFLMSGCPAFMLDYLKDTSTVAVKMHRSQQVSTQYVSVTAAPSPYQAVTIQDTQNVTVSSLKMERTSQSQSDIIVD